MMALCPEYPKWDQNPKFTPLSETTGITTPFICRVPIPRCGDGNRPRIHRNPRQFSWFSFNHNNESQSHRFRNPLTHRYFSTTSWFWYSVIFSLRLPTIRMKPNLYYYTLSVPWAYRRSWANYLAINVAIKLKYHKAKRIKIYYEICTHTIGAQFPTPKW